MATEQIDEANLRARLRLWPGVVIVVLQWLLRFVLPMIVPGSQGLGLGLMAGLLGGLAVTVWWGFFSRAPRRERWGAVVLGLVALLATTRVVHESIATGMMGLLVFVYGIPVLSLAFVVWAVASRRQVGGARRVSMVVTVLLACGVWTLFRTGGMSTTTGSDFDWRWAETPEERLLADEEEVLVASVPGGSDVAEETGAVWPGFRGVERDGIVRGVRIETDWAASPPTELWRRPVGPGWSSFAVVGERFYTQEQRGGDEVVSCYDVATGEPVWRHADSIRFWESNAGAGPRATPTFSDGRLYTLGATGTLNALAAGDGSLLWSRNAASDADAKLPEWGFSGSPLVVDDLVIVAASGVLVAYDTADGDLRWVGPASGESYSSPHRMTIDGVQQIVLMNEAGATSVSPGDGAVLWEHPWSGFSIVQPALIADGDMLISTGDRSGTRRITVAQGPNGWSAEERWTSTRLKAYFNDFVVHARHAFGFDSGILACIDVENGRRAWKGGRYGSGQLILLADQDLLLVLSEEGELVLVAATPDAFTEIARSPGIEGKTWNHPVLAGEVLLVRNDQFMAAFRLTLADG